jgi:SAM-dependent methyltransferase
MHGGKLKLNLACGPDIKKGYWNVDMIQLPGVDEVVDLNKKWPWKNNSIKEIFINCSLEHFENLNNFMMEAYRVLKNGGLLHIIVPHYSSGIAFHPDHRLYFNFAYFKFFLIPEERVGIYAFDSPYGFSGFKIIEDKIHYKSIISWIPIEKIKRQIIMMVGDLCTTIETKLECVK